MKSSAYILSLALLVSLLVAPKNAVASAQVVTPEAATETTRFFVDLDDEVIFLSPKGDRYVTATITGDVKRDGNWLTIMSGGLGLIDKAQPEVVARVFGRSLGDKNNYLKSFLTADGRLNWIDNDRVGFFWEDEEGLVQFFAVNVVTSKVKQLTKHPTSLYQRALGIGPDGALIYAAKAESGARRAQDEEDFRKKEYDGFVVEQDDFPSLMNNSPDRLDIEDGSAGYKFFYQSRPGRKPAEIKIGNRESTPDMPGLLTISQNGGLAILDDFPIEISPLWAAYTHEYFGRVAREAISGSSNIEIRNLRQLLVVDLSDYSVRPLWNALTQDYPPHVEWSPDGKQVLAAPTFLPPESEDEIGMAGLAIAVVDVASGDYQRIPYDDLQRRDLIGLRWKSESWIEVETKNGVFTYRKSGEEWAPARTEIAPKQAIQISVRSDLNTPPVLVAVDPENGRKYKLFDPNPELKSKFKLGHVEKVSWKARDGRVRDGELYYPADFKSGARYPFVLQTHGGSKRFSLYGYPETIGLGTGSGVFIAQLLAGRNIGVLQISNATGSVTQRESAKAAMNGYDGAVAFLVDKGIADPKRIGIQGFSRTGWSVQHSLVHSDFVYAAAIAADNVEGGYVENSLAWPGYMEAESGGDPSTPDGLKAWLENAVQFNPGRIHTPLLKVSQGPGGIKRIYGAWELFARLRRLNRPVELYFMPDQEAHGGHMVQNPRQVAALQNRALDWWMFWLKGEEDLSPEKVDQYARWRNMRTQQEKVLREPRPPLLKWTAEPIPGTAQPSVLDESSENIERPDTVQ